MPMEPLVLKKRLWDKRDWESALMKTKASKNLASLRFIGKLPNVTDTVELLFTQGLEYIELIESGISDAAAWQFSPLLRENKFLVLLNLSGSKLGNEGIAHISNALIKNDVLEHLSLDKNEIQDSGLLDISNSLLKNNKLKTLILSNNLFTEHGFIEFSKIMENIHLLALDLSGMTISTKALGVLHKAKQNSTTLEVLWLDSLDFDFQKDIINKLLLQEQRLSEFFNEIQVSMEDDRAGVYDVYNIQILNFDDKLNGKDCLKQVLDVSGVLSVKAVNEGSVSTCLRFNEFQNVSIWEKVKNCLPEKEKFCYHALYRLLQNPMIRQEMLITITTNEEENLHLSPKPRRIKAKKNRSFLLSLSRKNLSNLEYKKDENPKLLTKPPKKRSSFFFRTKKNNKVEQQTHPMLSKTSFTRGNSSFHLTLEDSDVSSMRYSNSSWKSHASNRTLQQSQKKKVVQQEKVAKYRFSTTKFLEEYRAMDDKKGQPVNLYYSSTVLPFHNLIIKGSLSLVLVFSYSEFIANLEDLQIKLKQAIQTFSRGNKTLLKVMFIVTAFQNEHIDDQELNDFLRDIRRSMRIFTFSNADLIFFVLKTENFNIQETLKSTIFSMKSQPYNYFCPNLVNFASLDYYYSLQDKIDEYNICLPADTVFHQNEMITQLADTGLILVKQSFVIIKPCWLLKIVKLLYNTQQFEQHMNKFKIKQDNKVIQEYNKTGILNSKLLLLLLYTNKHEYTNCSENENKNFLLLLKTFNIVSGYVFNTSLKQRERYSLLLKIPSGYKRQATYDLNNQFTFIYSDTLPLYFYEIFMTIVGNTLNDKMSALKKQSLALPKNKKRKNFIKKFSRNILLRPTENSIELRSKSLNIKLSKSSDKSIILSSNSPNYLNQLYKLANHLLKVVNLDYYYGKCNISAVTFKNEEQETVNIENLIRENKFPFDALEGRQQSIDRLSFNEIDKNALKHEDKAAFLEQLLLDN